MGSGSKCTLPWHSCLTRLLFLAPHVSPTPWSRLQLSCLQYYTGPSNGTTAMQVEDGCMENPKYYSYVAVLSLIATIMLVQVSHMVKLTLMLLVSGAVAVINIYAWCPIFDEYDRKRFQEHE